MTKIRDIYSFGETLENLNINHPVYGNGTLIRYEDSNDCEAKFAGHGFCGYAYVDQDDADFINYLFDSEVIQ